MSGIRSTRAEIQHLKRLINDCITYNLKNDEALEYIKLEIPRGIGIRQYSIYKRQLLSESTSLKWLSSFSKIGFVQNHHRLITDAKRIYNDSLRRYFREMAKGDKANRYLIMKLEDAYRANAKWLFDLSMEAPIVSQIKAKIEASTKTIDDVTIGKEVSETVRSESDNGNGNVTVTDNYRGYDKFISRTSEEDELTNDEQHDIESGNGDQKEGLDNGRDEGNSGRAAKRIRTRNDEFIEGGANVTDKVF